MTSLKNDFIHWLFLWRVSRVSRAISVKFGTRETREMTRNRTKAVRLSIVAAWFAFFLDAHPAGSAETVPPFPVDPLQHLARTCFQTGQAYSPLGNLRSDVAIVYGIDAGLPARVQSWRDRGYRIHVMTGVSWGQYDDYLSGRFDGINHEDEAQTDRQGTRLRHGNSRNVYYLSPGTNFGKFLCLGVQRALDAGAEAIHLEEPEFWARAGYSEGFKREWRSYYHEEWRPPHLSEEAQWRASKLKYLLYRRALEQVFEYVQEYNRRTGRSVACYVATHSLLNYAHWRIVSPESSLARLDACAGYIAQVWTGTARTPNVYHGQLRERSFETAFLEYGAMQNLVRGAGRTVWYLNDPIEDNPDHDWDDYRANWESTMVASLFQPAVWRYEVAPWPERVFGGLYPRRSADRKAIPPAYAAEIQIVANALNDLNQPRVDWDCGTAGIGILISDSLMFERADPHPSDPNFSHFYGLALPLLKRGMPVSPVQLENLALPHYLDPYRVLLLTYQGMKPLTPEAHAPLAAWVKHGGVLIVCDDDSDPYNGVTEWWNSGNYHYATPRDALFQELGFARRRSSALNDGRLIRVGNGGLIWIRKNPAALASDPQGDTVLLEKLKRAVERARLKWRETNYLLLRRGPFLIASGLDESGAGNARQLRGRFINLFDPELRVERTLELGPGSRFFLRDLTFERSPYPEVLASACKALPLRRDHHALVLAVEGVANTPAIVLISAPAPPRSVTLAGEAVKDFRYSDADQLLWIRFNNEARPRQLVLHF